jgi:hypothetical protein
VLSSRPIRRNAIAPPCTRRSAYCLIIRRPTTHTGLATSTQPPKAEHPAFRACERDAAVRHPSVRNAAFSDNGLTARLAARHR